MDIKDLTDNYKNLPSYRFKRKLNELVRKNHKFANLDENNRKVITDLVGKYSDRIRDGRGISHDTLRREHYNLYQHMDKLGLTKNDLDDIKDIMDVFKK